METLVSLLPLLLFISQVVFRKPSPASFPNSGMLSSPHQAPLPAWSRPCPFVFLRSDPCPTIKGPFQLRIATWLKTSINVPHRQTVLPVHRLLLPDLRLSSSSDLLSWLTAIQAVPTSLLIAWDHVGLHWMIQRRGQVVGIKTSNRERNVGDTVSTTTTYWRRLLQW